MRSLTEVKLSSRCLEPRDLLLLTVLGAVQSGCSSLSQVTATAKELAPQDWQPTNDLIGAGVKGAVKARLLDLACCDDVASPTCLNITDPGRSFLRDLLRRSLPSHMGGVGRACVAAKLSFLEHLPPRERSAQLEELAKVYRGSLITLQRRSQTRATPAYRSRHWLHHEIERFEWELAWLDRLRSEIGRQGDHPIMLVESL